jgi:hypothetical protein
MIDRSIQGAGARAASRIGRGRPRRVFWQRRRSKGVTGARSATARSGGARRPASRARTRGGEEDREERGRRPAHQERAGVDGEARGGSERPERSTGRRPEWVKTTTIPRRCRPSLDDSNGEDEAGGGAELVVQRDSLGEAQDGGNRRRYTAATIARV